MHVYITILLGLNRPTAFTVDLDQRTEMDRRTPQHLRRRSLQQLQTAKGS